MWFNMPNHFVLVSIRRRRSHDLKLFSAQLCKPGWFYLPSFGCYYIYQEIKTYDDAQQTCALQGGHLVSWETKAEYDAMANFLSENECKYLKHPEKLGSNMQFNH